QKVVVSHRAAQNEVVLATRDAILCARGDAETPLARLTEVPLTFGGAARYNVENVLGVVAVARALGLRHDAVTRALGAFGAADNPGRGELVQKGMVRVFLDFAHTPEAVRSALRFVSSLQPSRLTVVTGTAGDRSDGEIEEIARAVCEARPVRVFVRDLT